MRLSFEVRAVRAGAISPWLLTLGVVTLASLVLVREIRHPQLLTSFELGASRAGVSVLAGRLPSAAGSTLALLGLTLFTAQTVSRRAALYAAGVYASMPFAFLSARVHAVSPSAALATGALVLALALLGIGLGGGASGLAGARRAMRHGVRVAIVVAGTALAATCLLSVGPALLHGLPATTTRTFDALVPELAYGMGPWVLFAPLAVLPRARSASVLALSLATGAVLLGLTFASGVGMTPGLPVSAAAPFLAALLGVELASWHRSSTTFAALAAGVGWLVIHDLASSPARLLSPLGAVDGAAARTLTAAATEAANVDASLLAVTTGIVCAASWIAVPRWLRGLPGMRTLAVALPARRVLFFAPLAAGLALRASVFPALLARASSGALFATLAAHRAAGDELAVVEVDPRLVPPDVKPASLPSPAAGGSWLAAATAGATGVGSRRWLAMNDAPEALAEANASYRSRRGTNLPVVLAGDEARLLAASELRTGEVDRNPLDRIVLDRPPPRLTTVDARIEGAITVLGWQLVSDTGEALSSASSRGPDPRRARLQVALRVEAAPELGSCTFVHVDRSPARFAAEHRELAYPLRWWRPGEIIVDEFLLTLGADFTAGSYPLFWGMGLLPCEDDRRREITQGPSDGHGRVALGMLEVR